MHVLTSRTFFLSLIITISLNPTGTTQAEESAAEQEDQKPLEIREIVVSTTRLPSVEENIYAVPSKVTIITADDIERSGAKTVQEAIANTTGIVMYNQAGNNFEHIVDLRGFNGTPVTATTVFVDGVRVNEPQFNSVNFDLIPLEAIDRIEILPGPSAIYGKDVLGGVINIITKSGTDQRQATGEVILGSYERQRFTGNTSGPIGKLSYYANVTRELEKGYRQDSGARISRLFGKLGYRPTDQTDLAVTYTYVKDRLNQAGSLPLSDAHINPRANFTPGDFFDRENNFLRLNGSQTYRFGILVTGNAFYRKLQQEAFTVGQTSTTRTLTDTESWGGVLQLTHDSEGFGLHNNLVLGGEVTWNDFEDNLISGAFISRNSTDEEIAAAYVQDTLYLTPHLILSGAARYDRDKFDFRDAITPTNNAEKVYDRVTPRAGVTYLLSPESSVYFSYSQGFRVPTGNELFALGPFGSNPDLQAVRSNNFEVGLRTKIATWGDLAFALYQANVRDEIFFTCVICDFSFGDGQNRNVPKSRRRGIELTFQARPNAFFEGALNYTYSEAQFRSSFNLGAANRVEAGDSFPLVPKNRLIVTGTVHPTKEWRVSLSGLYLSTQFLQNDEGNTRERLPGYFALNGRVAYERPVPGGRLSGFLQVNNMLDNEYSTSGIFATNVGTGQIEAFVVPAPTITIYGGLSYRFESFPR